MGIVIHYDKRAHEETIIAVERKKELFAALLKEAGKHITISNKSANLRLSALNELKRDPKLFFAQQLKVKYSNTPGFSELSPSKLIEILELPIQGFYYAADAYLKQRDVDEDREIKKADFEKVATADEQIDRWNDAKGLCDAINLVRDKYRPRLGLMQLASDMSQILRFDINTNTIAPNPDWVLNG
jgi:hypothetical protein